MNESESVVQIDPDNLDKECINLPSQYLRHATKAAEFKRDVAELSAELDVVYSEIANDIRSDPTKYELEKVTEAAIKLIVPTLSKYKKAQAALDEARHKTELAQAVVWALECKKRSLTLLVELHGMGWFSNPKISRAGKEAVEQITQRHVRRPGRGERD